MSDKNTRKDEILEAALECFTEHAVEGTSVEMICESSGASVGSVYHHFGNKQGVVAALFVRGIHDYHSDLSKLMKPQMTAEVSVHEIVKSYLTWVVTNPDWARFILYSREKIFEERALQMIEERNQANTAEFLKWLQPHFDSGAIQNLPIEIFLALVLGPVQLYARRWVTGRAEAKSVTKLKTIFSQAAWLSVRG